MSRDVTSIVGPKIRGTARSRSRTPNLEARFDPFEPSYNKLTIRDCRLSMRKWNCDRPYDLRDAAHFKYMCTVMYLSRNHRYLVGAIVV